MSHHLDSPIARQDVRLDITDLYVFRGERGTVFAINVCHSIVGNIPVPGYHPEGMYEFKVDLDGDAVEDLTYRITFDERDEAGNQRFVLRQIEGARRHRSSRRGRGDRFGERPTSRPAPLQACASGPARPATRSGSSPTCCMRSDTRSRTAPKSASAIGRPTKRAICSPGTRSTPWCWKCPTPCCWRRRARTGASASGRWRRSPPTPADGARSTASACR